MYEKETSSSGTSHATDFTWTVGPSPGLRGNRSATDRSRYGAAMMPGSLIHTDAYRNVLPSSSGPNGPILLLL